MTGYSDGGNTAWDYATIKYNSAGVEQWVKRYNGPISNSIDQASAIAIDNFGNVYVTGNSYGGSLEKRDYATIKYNSEGLQLWVQRYNYNGIGYSGDIASSIVLDGLGNVYVTGYSDGDAVSRIDYATVKYNSDGIQQWVKRYNGAANGRDLPNSIAIDNSSNVYVTGYSDGIGTGGDFATIKYNSAGVQEWVQRYNGIANGEDLAVEVQVDALGNIYVIGESSFDYVTIKYNSLGNTLWIQRYESPINNVWNTPTSLFIDGSGNVFVTGASGVTGVQNDYATVKYNSEGIEQWVQIYNGSGNGNDIPNSVKVDASGNLYVTGESEGIGTGSDYATIKYSQQQLSIIQPSPFAKWISGETSTIQWTGWTNVNIKCILNFGTALQSEEIIASNIFLTQTEYPWTIPENTLSYQSKIVIENAANPTQKIESGIFRIKPYLLTRVNPDMTYYDYRKNRDDWGFFNHPDQLWHSTWYQQFNYQGIDPFTGSTYSQWQGSFAFKNAKDKNFPDWVSFVNTFTVGSCYWNTALGIYKHKAILKWKAIKEDKWNGSCFGLGISNGIVFRNKLEFQTKYPNYPPFVQPFMVTEGDQVRRTINEIFTHQFGEPHQSYSINEGKTKKPTQTLNEIKTMLKSDNDEYRTISIRNNSGEEDIH
ncbi:MAG: SBBP repeat-containing protein [Ignavibacteria bacterium]|nr:SBBP repeat-containing protein [Ignavibacteria bacterium]